MKNKIASAFRNNVPAISRGFIISAVVCAFLHLFFVLSPFFADVFNRSFGAVMRFALAKLTGWLPFSFAEAMILFSPIALVYYIIYAVRKTKEGKGIRCVAAFISVIPLLYALFVLTFAAGYYAPRIDEKMGFQKESVSEDSLFESALYLTDKLNDICPDVCFVENSCSVMPYSNSEMIGKINEAYEKYDDRSGLIVNFRSAVKQIALSEPMTYTHISGIYTFFTGEANINVNYPDFILPFTTAHEMAHQRGVAREDEANFVSYLICEQSDDAFVRYSAYLNMFEYVASELAATDMERYVEVRSRLDVRVKDDLAYYSDFFAAYRDSSASKITSTVNDAYLKSQWTAGIDSYDQVVRLFVMYYGSQICE